MKYNKTLNENDFNRKVLGKCREYPCWVFTKSDSKKLSEGTNLICLVGALEIDSISDYCYINFHRKVNEFFSVIENFQAIPINSPVFLYFIPILDKDLDKVKDIIINIIDKNPLLICKEFPKATKIQQYKLFN